MTDTVDSRPMQEIRSELEDALSSIDQEIDQLKADRLEIQAHLDKLITDNSAPRVNASEAIQEYQATQLRLRSERAEVADRMRQMNVPVSPLDQSLQRKR